MNKQRALEIFSIIASQYRDTLEGHTNVRAAYDFLSTLVEPVKQEAGVIKLP